MTRDRIQAGQQVRWRTYPDAGAGPEYEGVVVAFVPADALFGETIRRQVSGLVYVGILAAIPNAQRTLKKRDRYVVRCPLNAKPQNVSYRAVSATLLERQNPSAAKEEPHAE